MLSPLNDYIYITYYAGMKVYNMSDVRNLKFISAYSEWHMLLLGISPDGNRIIYRSTGIFKKFYPVALLDVSDKNNITFLDGTADRFSQRMTWKTSGSFNDGAFDESSRYFYVAAGRNGLITYDLSNNDLQNSSQTSGVHLGGMFNTTKDIYSISIYKRSIYLSHTKRETTTIGNIAKGVDVGYLIYGRDIFVSNNGEYLLNMGIYPFSKGIKILKITNKEERYD